MDRDQDLRVDLPDGVFQVAFPGVAGAVGLVQGDPEVFQPVVEHPALVPVLLAFEDGFAGAIDVIGVLRLDIDELHELVEAGEHDVPAGIGLDLAERDHVVHVFTFEGLIIPRQKFAAFRDLVINLEGFVGPWIGDLHDVPETVEEEGVFRVDHERPACIPCSFPYRMKPVDVAHGEFRKDKPPGFPDDAFDLLIDLLFGIELFRIGSHPGAFAKHDAGFRSGRLGDKFIRQALHGTVPPEIPRVNHRARRRLDDVSVGAGSGMLDMDRQDGQVFQPDDIAAFEEMDVFVLSDIRNRGEKRGVGIEDALGSVSHVERNLLIEKGEMPDMVAVVVGEENAIDVRFLVRKIGELELGAAVELRDLRNDAEFKTAFESVGRPRRQPFVEVILPEVERLPEIEIDLGFGSLQKDLVAADLSCSAEEGQGKL